MPIERTRSVLPRVRKIKWEASKIIISNGYAVKYNRNGFFFIHYYHSPFYYSEAIKNERVLDPCFSNDALQNFHTYFTRRLCRMSLPFTDQSFGCGLNSIYERLSAVAFPFHCFFGCCNLPRRAKWKLTVHNNFLQILSFLVALIASFRQNLSAKST